MGSGGIRQAFDALFQADLDLKGARGIPEQAVMEVLVVRLARLSRENRRSSPMSVRVRNLLMEQLGALRHEPIDKRIRATLGDHTVVDSTRRGAGVGAEAHRPHLRGARRRHRRRAGRGAARRVDQPEGVAAMGAPQLGDRPVLDPSIPFSVHTADGDALVVRVAGADRDVDAFRVADPDLAGYVLLDFDGFDAWYEEDELNVAHPRDPFHRVDIVHSSRHVRVEVDGTVVAESTLPVPAVRAAVAGALLLRARRRAHRPARSRATSSRTAPTRVRRRTSRSAGRTDLAWGYRDPLRDASEVTGRIAFFNERADIFVDGERQERPITPWSRRRDQG